MSPWTVLPLGLVFYQMVIRMVAEYPFYQLVKPLFTAKLNSIVTFTFYQDSYLK